MDLLRGLPGDGETPSELLKAAEDGNELETSFGVYHEQATEQSTQQSVRHKDGVTEKSAASEKRAASEERQGFWSST